MQNDVLATGIMSFMMHELVYFGRSLPWILIDTSGVLKNYKIQSVSGIISRVDIKIGAMTDCNSTKCPRYASNGIAPNSSFSAISLLSCPRSGWYNLSIDAECG